MDIIKLWMNFGLAWLAVVLTVLVSIIFFTRILGNQNRAKFSAWLKKINTTLRKHHKILGIILIISGLVHGLFSSESIFTFNIGTICWVVSVLLGLNWMLRKYLKKHRGWMYYHRLLTVAFLALIVWHIIDVGGIQAPTALFGQQPRPIQQQINDPAPTAAPATSYHGAQLKDGTYIGQATGFQPGLQVSVVVKDNAIVSVDVLSHNEENSRYYSRPIAIVPQEIVDAQSTEVDTVSSGTFTSIGIMNAVNNALSQALVSGELPKDQVLPLSRHGRK
jgi:uncharacterized protein with FMN-binding domain